MKGPGHFWTEVALQLTSHGERVPGWETCLISPLCPGGTAERQAQSPHPQSHDPSGWHKMDPPREVSACEVGPGRVVNTLLWAFLPKKGRLEAGLPLLETSSRPCGSHPLSKAHRRKTMGVLSAAEPQGPPRPGCFWPRPENSPVGWEAGPGWHTGQLLWDPQEAGHRGISMLWILEATRPIKVECSFLPRCWAGYLNTLSFLGLQLPLHRACNWTECPSPVCGRGRIYLNPWKDSRGHVLGSGRQV